MPTPTWPATPHGEAWSRVLHGPFQTLMRSPWWLKVTQDTNVFPPENIFDFARYCPPDQVRVVIVGQDPYPSLQAHGLAFSVAKGNIPASLKNILKLVKKTFPVSENHGNLTYWALQGVLLLNTVLTYHDAGDKKPSNDHMKQGCEEFTDAVIKYISDNNQNVVFMLWGNEAHKKGTKELKSRHCVLETSHPSPLVRSDQPPIKGYFRDCDHFNKCNKYLMEKGKEAINWSLPDSIPLF